MPHLSICKDPLDEVVAESFWRAEDATASPSGEQDASLIVQLETRLADVERQQDNLIVQME